MKFIITESQKNFLWLLRRLDDPDMVHHMTDIVVEGFDYVKPCDYIDNQGSYVHDILDGSVITFLNSYDDKFEGKEGYDELYRNVYDVMKKKYLRTILHEYNSEIEECED